MYRSGDPLKDFDRWDAEQQRKLDKLPKCYYCDEPIQGDFCFVINGECICEDCLEEHHKKYVDDLI